MTPLGKLSDRWPAISALLDEALSLPATERADWLAGLDGERAAHRDAVAALLAHQEAVESRDFLGTLPRLDLDLSGTAPVAGSQIGGYRLIEEIGQGGMGTVWLAERADGLLRRRVALKLPRQAWGDALAERMARERDILASLEHEHIARLYDAGVDALGRPFLAMEYVAGEPLDAWCRERALGLRERIGLLLQAMAAVAHAHARLVVHRDLKPGNILVTRDGQVRLLDFGIAKLLEGELTPETALTQLAGRALTLDYASPEQIRGEPLATATDIYSMAVVAFELLTGARPYRLKRASAAQLEDAIASVEPPLASASVADARLARQLRGDLDSILNKALKKSPAERYPTMEAFAHDLRRHLAGEPVEARPDSLGYRAASFVRRYRVQVGAGAVALIALVGGASAALWQAHEARLQAGRAQAEAETARAVQGFIESVFSANTGGQADPTQGRATTAAQLLDRGAERIDSELQHAPAARLRLLTVMAAMYEDMVLTDKQLAMQTRRLELARASTGPTSEETVLAMADMAHALTSLERRDEAQALLRDGAAILDARHDDDSRARMRIELMQASLDRRMDPEHGLAAARRAVALAERDGPNPDLIDALHIEGDNAYYVGDNETARAAFARAIALAEAYPQHGASSLPFLYGSLGNAQRALGAPADALVNLRRGLALERERHDDPMTLHFTEMQLANFLYDTGRFRESIEVIAPAHAWAREWARDWTQEKGASFGAQAAMQPAAHGRALVAYGRVRDGLAALDEAQAMAARLESAPELEVPLLGFRARALVELGRLDEAQAAIARADAIVKAEEGRMPTTHVDPARRRWQVASGRAAQALADFQAARAAQKLPAVPAASEPVREQAESAWLALAAGNAPAAEAQARQTLAVIGAGSTADFERDHEARATLVLGQALLRQQRAAEAQPVLEQAVARWRALVDNRRSPALAEALAALADARRALGERSAAAAAEDEARRIRQRA
ncbi:serine/threonine-protein kinase [Derxia lacustris]|uniref:serine/threonine-protein kinase n=1 Tax=Derxia lacustris TaxID=764842 RepID=UPI00111C4BC3|nr:serine/threonine-protein kinase [Derxia lacustris]